MRMQYVTPHWAPRAVCFHRPELSANPARNYLAPGLYLISPVF